MSRPSPRLVSSLVSALAWMAGASACEVGDDPRAAEIASVLARADEPLLRTRPALVASKYRAMAATRFAFFRGSFPLYVHDAENDAELAPSAFDTRAFPLSVGDAHPENVGTLLASDGSLAIELNDFDAADRWPWLWEVRRLATGMAVAAADSNTGSADARAAADAARGAIARAVALGYARAILADGTGERIEDGGESVHLSDLLERAREDAEDRSELQELTFVRDGARRLLRGGIDEDDPENVYLDADPLVVDAMPSALTTWRASLTAPVGGSFTMIKDVARELGSGVASRPRARFIVLVEGPTEGTDDDVILEVKEIADSGARGFVPPGVAEDGSPAARAVGAARLAWARPDAEPLWGHATLLGLPVQIRAEREAHKTLRVARLVDELGTPEALVSLGEHLGALLGRVHRASDDPFPGTTNAIAAAIGSSPDAFADEQADVAVRWSNRVADDHRAFVGMLEDRGPLLGFQRDAIDALDPEERALFGEEPPP